MEWFAILMQTMTANCSAHSNGLCRLFLGHHLQVDNFQIDICRFPADADSIGAAVCARAEQLPATVVALAKRDRGVIEEMFTGSTAAYVVRHCTCPVAMVHGAMEAPVADLSGEPLI